MRLFQSYNGRDRGRGIISPAFVCALLAEHDSRRRNNKAWLWSLSVLELWYRHLEN